MKLGTKLTLYLSLVIILALSGYGYLDILSRQEMLVGKMKADVKRICSTLRVSLEVIQLPEEREYVSGLIDAVSESERNVSVLVYYRGENLVFRSHSLQGESEPYLEMIRKSIRENRPEEKFETRQSIPVYLYALPFRDRTGRHIGGLCFLQNTTSMQKEIRKAKWNIMIMIVILIGATIVSVILGTRKWITQPLSRLMGGIHNVAKGNLDHRIDLKGSDELSVVARAFNQMSLDLKKAQEKIVQEGENRLELEKTLRQSEKLATIGQLASGLAHEIGTPLNIISGRTELIRRNLENKEGIQRNLDIIFHQTERITKIIQQLLGYVRKKKPQQLPFQVSGLLESTLDLLDHEIRKQGVKVVKDWGEDLPAVNGDPDQLQQVFLNLMLNGLQSMPKGGTLRLSASLKVISKEGLEPVRQSCIEICVGDTGAGMETEALQKIFDPFFTTKDGGTGLGLMVTQGIVHDHEGWIQVESEIGKGSVFTVYLPSLQRE